MNPLKEKREERSKEESKENQQQQPRAREASLFGDLDVMSHAWQRGITARDLEDTRQRLGAKVEEITAWLRYMDDVGWCFANGAPVNGQNFRRPLRMWVLTERRLAEERGNKRGRERAEPRRESEAERKARLAKVAADPAAWVLCDERCRHYVGGRCAKGVAVPPMHQPHPHPPEECARYAAKGSTDAQERVPPAGATRQQGGRAALPRGRNTEDEP